MREHDKTLELPLPLTSSTIETPDKLKGFRASRL